MTLMSMGGTVTIVSNLGQSANSSQSFGSAFNTNMIVAGPFTTDNTPGALSTISIHLYGSSHPFGGLGPAVISLYSDSAGLPGSSLAILSGNPFPTNVGVYTFTNTTPLTLGPNTTYWVVASSPSSISNATYSFGLVPVSTLDAGSFWTLGLEKYKIGNDNWGPDSFYPQMNVVVTPLAPPMAISLAAGGVLNTVTVNYPTPDYPFDLKQNSDLVPTGWVNATGDKTTVQSNRTFVRFPFSGSKMFFRLDLH
jgi:hypothetical protein